MGSVQIIKKIDQRIIEKQTWSFDNAVIKRNVYLYVTWEENLFKVWFEKFDFHDDQN